MTISMETSRQSLEEFFSIKSGKVKGRQRYKCKPCNYFYTVSQKSDTGSDKERKLALTLYLEGLGFRCIGRILGFSHVAIYQWIKQFGEQVSTVKSKHSAKVVELDEMHSYIGHKKTVAGYGLLLIDLGNAFCMLSPGTVEPKQERNYGQK